MAMIETTGNGKKEPRTVRVQKVYISADAPKGDVRASVESLIHTARLHFKENGYLMDLNLRAIGEEHPNWLYAAAAFGALTAAANAATSAKSETDTKPDLEDMISAAEDRFAMFRDGQWSAEAAGPRTNDFVLAYIESRRAAGINVTESTIEALRERLANESLTPKKMMEDVKVRAAYQAIKARKAAERAAQAQEKAEGASISTDLDDLLAT